MEISFPHYYSHKSFLADASRLRDLVRMRTREKLTEAEVAEVAELRKKIRRANADAVLLSVIKTRQSGGLLFF